MKDILLATGTTKRFEQTGDDIALVETVIVVTDGVTLKVFNREIADLEFGRGQHVEFKFTEEIASAFVNIDAIKPAELLAAIAGYSGVTL